MTSFFKEIRFFGYRIGLSLLADRIRFRAHLLRPFTPIPYEGQGLIFVCKGNICRSPFAEALARHRGTQAKSVGLRARNGAPANEQAIQTAPAYHVDLNQHRAHPFHDTDLAQQMIVCMEVDQAREILVSQPELAGRVTLLGLYGEDPVPSIPDPYGLSQEAFTYVFDLIARKVADLIDSRPGSC